MELSDFEAVLSRLNRTHYTKVDTWPSSQREYQIVKTKVLQIIILFSESKYVSFNFDEHGMYLGHK